MTEVILKFLDTISIKYSFGEIEEEGFLPGLELQNGCILIDLAKLKYPGDILHEAGHLACMPPDLRTEMTGILPNTDITAGGEMMAMAWSFAVCKYLGFEANVVFHEYGYKNASQSLIAAYEAGVGPGIPLLQWLGMCYDETNAKLNGKRPFPYMYQWVCSVNKYNG